MLVKRGNIWRMRGFAPEAYFEIEKRKEIWVSLETKSEREDASKELVVWREFISAWEAQLGGDLECAEFRSKQAEIRARAMG